MKITIGDYKEAAQVLFTEARHVFEAGIAPSVADGHGLSDLSCPADDALAQRQGRLPDGLGVEGASGAEDQAVDRLVVEVDGDFRDAQQVRDGLDRGHEDLVQFQ